MFEYLEIKEFSPLYLRAYTWQAIRINNDLSEKVKNYITTLKPELFLSSSELDLNDFSNDELTQTLEESCLLSILPDSMFYFTNNEKSIDRHIETEEYKKVPELFTGIVETDSELGLLVMESFCQQIRSLYTKEGKSLSGFCGSIILGGNGKVLLWNPDNLFWDVMQYDGNELNQVNGFGPWDSPDDFFDKFFNYNAVEDLKSKSKINFDMYSELSSMNPSISEREKSICK